MKTKNIENAIIVRNNTRLEQLVERFNTQSQAKFYIKQQKANYVSKKAASPSFKGKSSKAIEEVMEEEAKQSDQDFNRYEEENERFYTTLTKVTKEVSTLLKTKVVEAGFLSNYLFTEKDLVIVIGQDGLVANTAKYVNRIPIIAINPDPGQYDGVLLPFDVSNYLHAVRQVVDGEFNYTEVTMGEVCLDDGQRLLAFNDFFIGPDNHSSARYKISYRNHSEAQSSSGIIISTGAGSTGWLSSLFNMVNGMNKAFYDLTSNKHYEVPQEAEELIFVVREPFISKTSDATVVVGKIMANEKLVIESNMPSNGIIFSDGIQNDYLSFTSGTIAEIGIANEKAILVKL